MSYVKPSPRPLDRADLDAVGDAFGIGRPAVVLTPEQKAEQEAKLAPYLVSPPGLHPSRRSEAARAGRLRVLARKAAERDEAQS